MSRYPHPYAQHCDANCGCCEPQAESYDSAFLIPESNEEVDCGDQD